MQDNKRKSFSYSIWMMGGLYLIYLAYSLLKSGEALTGVQLLFAVLFAAIGLFFAVNGGYRMWKLDREKREKEKREAEAAFGAADDKEKDED